MPRTFRCSSCPRRSSQHIAEAATTAPLFPDDVSLMQTYARITPQERALREAIAPYLCLDQLRTLVSRRADLQAALQQQPVPGEIHALLTLITTLLKPRPDEAIGKAADLAAMLMLEMGSLDHEEFWVVCLDTKNHVQTIQHLYAGTLNSAAVRVSEVFRLPLRFNSASIIVAHCHPSGSTTPSPEDLHVTTLLVQAGRLLDIEVLDHLIIAKGNWLSMREQRLGSW